MKKSILIFLLLSMSFPCFAETILLKSGKIVEGKLIEKTDKYIKIDFMGVPLTYFFNEIESINGELLPSVSDSSKENKEQGSVSLSSLNKEVFVNEEWGYSLEYPSNWKKVPKEERHGCAMGLEAKISGESGVMILIKRGILTERDIKDKTNLADLAETFFRFQKVLRENLLNPLPLNINPDI